MGFDLLAQVFNLAFILKVVDCAIDCAEVLVQREGQHFFRCLYYRIGFSNFALKLSQHELVEKLVNLIYCIGC